MGLCWAHFHYLWWWSEWWWWGGFCPKVQRCPLNCGRIWQKHFHLTNALSNHSLLGEEFVFVLSSRMLIQLIWCSFVFDQDRKLTKLMAGWSEFTLSLTNAGMRLKELLIPTFSCFISNGCSYTAVIYQIRACCSTNMSLDFYPLWNMFRCRTQIAFCGNLWWPWRTLKWDSKCT